MPSLRPLSTLRPWRILDGSRGSVTTAWPSAASVGARRTASTSASGTVSAPNSAAATIAPSTIVSGSPIPSRRAGTAYSLRNVRRLMRDASAKSTTVSVASASSFTDSLAGGTSTSPSARAPTMRPTPTKTIAGVSDVPSTRRETIANPINVSVMVASDPLHAPRLRRERVARVPRRPFHPGEGGTLPNEDCQPAQANAGAVRRMVVNGPGVERTLARRVARGLPCSRSTGRSARRAR